MGVVYTEPLGWEGGTGYTCVYEYMTTPIMYMCKWMVTCNEDSLRQLLDSENVYHFISLFLQH